MDIKKAVRLAVHAIRREIQLYSFDAAMLDLYHASYPESERASARRKELLQAIETLTALVTEPPAPGAPVDTNGATIVVSILKGKK